ncbi:MAG: Crp/Fnr family transcriptional regulator [Negativibacillus massiliensis]|nr:Crp/Fnr family transcriptional regulator [Negativibacillus massiliensis]
MENKNLTKIALMQGLNEQEISLILNCLQAKIKKYEKGETIFQEGEKIEEIGIIFSGTVTVQRNDYWGNRSIVALLGEMDVFGETFACLNQSSDVQVIAEESSEILFLQVNRVLTTCSSSCQFHNRLIRNLLGICAKKNYQMNVKVDILSQKTTREKLLTFLSRQAIYLGKQQFEIPFNRQQLADYLSVDRSAMTVELGKLKREGIIDFQKNVFTLNR